MNHPIHSLFRFDRDSFFRDSIAPKEFLITADQDRYLNLYDMSQRRLVRSLIATNGITSADVLISKGDGIDTWDTQMLAVVTANGLVELFSKPFFVPAPANGDMAVKRKALIQKSHAQIKLVNSPTDKCGQSAVAAASLQGPDLFIASVDGGVDVSIQKVRWQDEGTGELLFDSTKEVIRVRTGSSLNASPANGIKDLSKSQVDESRAVVLNGVGHDEDKDAAEVELPSSGEESGEEEDDSDEDEEDEDESESEDDKGDGEDSEDDAEMVDAQENPAANQDLDEDGAEGEEPSFGEMLASRTSQAIDIADAFAPESSALAKVESGHLALPTGMSLGTVLTQALRSNDRNLLEACLHTSDLDVVRNTIQRLDSSLAGNLLSKLAERISSRPGRYGDLQLWVQQLCVAHGAAIASQPAVLSQVKTLYRVLNERSKCLSPLLLLKGKLDMLNAQVIFRKQLAAQRAERQGQDGEPGMIYIEGQQDNWESDDDHDEAAGDLIIKPNRRSRKALEAFEDEQDDEDEDMPLVNGVGDSNEEDEDDDDDKPQLRTGTLVDDEAAEEEDEEEEEEESEDGDDVDSEEEEEDSEEDSEMYSFINDGSVDFDGQDELDAVDEEEDETPQKPAKKRSRHR
jgi:U3 small nucleolar RNA-associated protein 5